MTTSSRLSLAKVHEFIIRLDQLTPCPAGKKAKRAVKGRTIDAKALGFQPVDAALRRADIDRDY